MRHHLRLILLGLVALALVGAAQHRAVSAAQPTPRIFLPLLLTAGTPLQTDQQRQFAEEVVRLANQERAQAGCPALTIDSDLVQAAQAHSADMANRNYFSHTNLEGASFLFAWRPPAFGGAPGGENIAAGQTTPAAVMSAWMASQGHRENILTCGFQTIGVGFASNPGSTYVHYWTQDFGW